MKKTGKKLINKFKRVWVWSKINKLPEKLRGDSIEELDPTAKKLVMIFKNLIKEPNTNLYKVQIDYDVLYEIHDDINKIYISLLHKSNCSELHLMEFPHKNRALSEHKSIINSTVSDRMIHSITTEMQLRTISLHEKFNLLKKQSLEEISKKYEHE